jgi:hypothetical protein
MPSYWDSSALVNALAAPSVAKRLESGEHLTRTHAFVESFHHISGRGLPLKDGRRMAVTPEDAAAMVRKLAGKLKRRDLSEEETLRALDDAQSRGVKGRMVHDWMHVCAAKLSGAEVVVTRDNGMSGLASREGIKAEWP